MFGLEGSPTWVEDIRLVEPDRLGVVIRDETPDDAARQVAEMLRERLAALDQAEDSTGPTVSAPGRYTGTQRSIWVVVEMVGSAVRHATLEMLGKARALAPITQSEIVAVFIGSGPPDGATVTRLAFCGRRPDIDPEYG